MVLAKVATVIVSAIVMLDTSCGTEALQGVIPSSLKMSGDAMVATGIPINCIACQSAIYPGVPYEAFVVFTNMLDIVSVLVLAFIFSTCFSADGDKMSIWSKWWQVSAGILFFIGPSIVDGSLNVAGRSVAMTNMPGVKVTPEQNEIAVQAALPDAWIIVDPPIVKCSTFSTMHQNIGVAAWLSLRMPMENASSIRQDLVKVIVNETTTALACVGVLLPNAAEVERHAYAGYPWTWIVPVAISRLAAQVVMIAVLAWLTWNEERGDKLVVAPLPLAPESI